MRTHPHVPEHFYGWWPELERIELGDRVASTYDETSSLMHRLIRAVGGTYDISHNYWQPGMAARRGG